MRGTVQHGALDVQTSPGSDGAPRGRRSLRLRTYFVGLTVLFVISAAAGVGFVRVQTRHDARRAALRDARFAADGAARLLAQGTTVLRDGLRQAATSPSIGEVLARPGSCALGYAEVGAFSTGHIDILRSDGSVVCSTRGDPGTSPLDYGGEPWLPAALAGSVVLAPVTDAATGEPAAVIAEPFPGGTLVAFVDLRPVGVELAAAFGGARGLEFVVTSPDGERVLARSVEPARWVGASLAGTESFPASGATDRPDLDGKARLYAVTSVDGVGWKVHAGADRAAALAAARRLYHRQLAIILIALVVVLAAAAVVQRRIARPIRQLGAAVRASTSDGATAIAVRGPAEVVALAADFDELLATVERELADRRRAEEVARAAEEEARATARAYRLLFANNPQPMWVYDQDTLAIFEVNQAAVDHYGYSRDEFLSMTIEDLRPSQDRSRPPESGRADASAGNRSGPSRHVKRDGTVIEVEITAHDVDFRDSRGRLVMASDVTERERLQQQLSQTQRLESLGQLAGGIAHDFNNLLGAIMNYTAFVAEELDKAAVRDGEAHWEAVRADLAQVDKAAQRAAGLTRQLLAFARREVIRPRVVDLNAVVAEVEQLLRRSLGEHIELTCSLSDAPWSLEADPGQLEQVLVNLAINGRDAMPQGGRLTIETDNVDVDESYAAGHPGLAPGRYVRLRVSDTGAGMDAVVLQRAFEPFFTTKPKGEGTGLGLATIYGIVTQAGGHAQLYSEPGLGTTFSALFPASEGDRRELPAVVVGGSREGAGETVLVVEDEDAIREVARRILVRHGYQVITAATGPEALELARGHQGPIDLLLTDVVMPGMLGTELAPSMVALHPAVRVLYMSGYAQSVLGAGTTLPTGTVLLEKPFSEPALLAKVSEALDPARPGGDR